MLTIPTLFRRDTEGLRRLCESTRAYLPCCTHDQNLVILERRGDLGKVGSSPTCDVRVTLLRVEDDDLVKSRDGFYSAGWWKEGQEHGRLNGDKQEKRGGEE